MAGEILIADEQNIYRMFEELGQYNQAEAHYTAANPNPGSEDMVRPEVLDAWIGVFFQPLYSPLHNLGEELCLFNHTMSFLQFYSFEGELLRQLPITYHKQKKWTEQILQDDKTGKFYTVFNDKQGKRFYEIDLQKGTIEPSFKIKTAFVEKMIIYDDQLYYQDSNIIPGTTNRILHKVRMR